MPLVEQVGQGVEPVGQLGFPGLFEGGAEGCRPARVAGGKQIGQPQERRLKLAHLAADEPLAGGEFSDRFLRRGREHDRQQQERREENVTAVGHVVSSPAAPAHWTGITAP